jgi:hypothetical protein
MTKLEWQVIRDPDNLDLTSYVLDIRISWGRETFVSPYQGRIAKITIRNNNQQSDYFNVNRSIYINELTAGVYGFLGVVLTREFFDNPGDGKGSTCVVTLVDYFTLAGNNQTSYTFTDPNGQLPELAGLCVNEYGSWYVEGDTDTQFTVGAFTGNVQSQMQQVILADHGIFQIRIDGGYYKAPSNFAALIMNPAGFYGTVNFGRIASPTQIAYESITRSEAAVESTWFNNATVTGSSTSATKTNGSSAQYGLKSFTLTSTQTQFVNSSAEWWANNFISPTRLSLDLAFLDLAQDSDAMFSFMGLFIGEGGMFTDVTWTVPGGASVTQTFFPDKISLYATPESTRFTLGMTNINTYQSFILNSSTFGILDTSRLGVGPAV